MKLSLDSRRSIALLIQDNDRSPPIEARPDTRSSTSSRVDRKGCWDAITGLEAVTAALARGLHDGSGLQCRELLLRRLELRVDLRVALVGVVVIQEQGFDTGLVRDCSDLAHGR